MDSDSTFQELLSSFSKDVFVGRGEQLTLFEKALDAVRPTFLILGISGQGGIGKTTLLERFQEVAKTHKVNTALTNEDNTNIPDVLASLAKQLTELDFTFKNFNERYKKYRELKQEVEGDIDAPKGLMDFALQSATRIGLKSLRHLPIAGDVADVLLNKDAENEIAKEVSAFASYIAQKFSNKDDRTLMLETSLELSKIFISDFNNPPIEKKIILFFDTYEKTSQFIDDWLQNFIGGKYGTFSSETLFVVAGRNPLNQSWTQYRGAIRQIELSKFTEQEAREYLERSGVTDEKDVIELIQLSDCLPVLLAFLVSTPGKIPTDVSSTAVERFLNGTTPQQKEAALALSVPRIFNKDLLDIIFGDQEADFLFEWISSSHFVRSGSYGWYYHEVVRSLLLKYFHLRSSQNYFGVHKKIETYYDEQIKQSSQLAAISLIDSLQKLKTEKMYHKISHGGDASLTDILDAYLENIDEDKQYAQNLIQCLEQVGEENGSDALKSWAKDLSYLFESFSKKKIEKEDLQKVLNTTNRILDKISSPNSISRVHKLRGLIFNRDKDYKSAISSFSDAIEKSQNIPEYYFYRAHAHESSFDLESALADFTKSIELKPNDGKYYRSRGMCYLLMENHEAAIEDISTAIKLEPEDHAIWHTRAHYYILTQNYSAAKDDFLKALELDPDLPDNYACYAIMLFDKMKNEKEAISIINKAIKLAPDYATFLYRERARYFVKTKNFKSALVDINKIIKLEPGKDFDYYSRGIVKNKLYQYESAVNDFNVAISANPADQKYYHERAHSLDALDKKQEALADFNKAIELAPDNINNYYCRSLFCAKIGELDIALKDISKVIEIDGNTARLFIIRGQINQALKKNKAAGKDFDNAVKLQPDADAYNLRAKFHESIGRNKKALTDYSKAIELAPQSASLLHDRAHLLEELSLYQEANEDFSSAIKIEPESSRHIQCRGVLNYKQDNLRQAENDFNTAISLKPDVKLAYYYLGRIHEKLGSYQEALNDFSKATEFAPKETINLAWRGYIYSKLKMPEKAIEDFETITSLEKNLITVNTLYVMAFGYVEMHKNSISLKYLGEVFKKDSGFIEKAKNESRLSPLHKTKGFKVLIEEFAQGRKKTK